MGSNEELEPWHGHYRVSDDEAHGEIVGFVTEAVRDKVMNECQERSGVEVVAITDSHGYPAFKQKEIQ